MISMFKYLFLLLFITGSYGQIAQAALTEEDLKLRDSDVFFSLGGGARLRQYSLQKAGAGGSLNPNDENSNQTSHRLQLDVRLDKGEYFQTFFRVINTSVWGNSRDTDDQFLMQQGWGKWKVSDFLNLRFGRTELELGRGLVYGLNEWENLPNFYDAISALFDWSTLDISIHALKFRELDRSSGSLHAFNPEITHYILDLNFKELSDMISMADISFIQIVGDESLNALGVTQAQQRVQRFNFDLVATGVYFETSASLSYAAGTSKLATVETRVKQFMMDGEAKWIMPEWSRFNLWAGGHFDSGDESPNDDENTQYDPLNYNLHNNAGRLDFFKFGNLTFLRAGASVHLLSDWYAGVEYFKFEKTKATGKNYLERSILQNELALNTLSFGANKDLGQEVDLWVGKVFQSGVKLELSVNYLKPGAGMSNAYTVGSLAARPLNDAIYNFIADVGIFF